MIEKKTRSKKPPATTPSATPAKSDPNHYRIKAEEWGFTRGDTDSQVLAALTTRSALTATTYKAFAGAGDELEVGDLMRELRKAGEEVAGGDMSRVEKMLAHQALTLDAIFNNMALRSSRQDTFKGIEVLMRLALKAQAQARSTAEALALLKNPQPYIRQANMTTGPQQVNNAYVGAPSNSGKQSGAGNIHSEQNKLLEASDGNFLDTRAQGAASRVDPHMATLEEVHRSKVSRRQTSVE
jgi:hypothetical protein